MTIFLRTRIFYLLLSALLTIVIAGCSSPMLMTKSDRSYAPASEAVMSISNIKSKRRTWKRSSLLANKVKIKIGDKESLPIHSMRASIKVDGFRARVLLDYHFYNHHQRNFEATFQLRLPNGASPYYLAFGESIYRAHSPQFHNGNFYQDSDTGDTGFKPEQIRAAHARTTIKLREARMVTRKTAVRAYHNTVHRRVDPALLEWTGSGVFNGRLFPIQANKLHRVVIAYDIDLRQTNSRNHFTFPLPNKIKHKHVSFDIATFKGSRVNLKNHHHSIAGHNRTHIVVKNPQKSALHLTVSRRPTTVLAGNNKDTKQSNFVVRLDPRLSYRQSIDRNNRAIFLVDISLGSQPESFNRSLKLMTQILARNQTKIKQFAVLFFNARGFWWKKSYSHNTFDNRKRLSRYANRLSLQGGSDIDLALSMASAHKTISSSKANLYLLSDGAANWGETRLNAITRRLRNNFKNKLFAFSTSTVGVNNSVLNRLSSISNGAHYTVINDRDITKAAIAIRANSWRIKNIQVSNGSDIVVQGNPSQIYPGQILTIAGRGLPKAGDRIRLTITDGKRTKIRYYRISLRIRSTLASRAYGIIAVNLMESLQRKRENHLIKSYALHYKIVGRNASLLMLESERDYQSYNIKPKNNILIVSQTSASRIISALLVQQQAARSDKELFVSMLSHLKYTDGVKPIISKELNELISRLPENAFSIRFNTPGEYRAVNLLHSRYKRKTNSVHKIRAIDIKSDRAYQLIINKYNELLADKQFSRAVVALSSLLELNAGKVKHMRLVSYYLLRMQQHRDAWFLFQQITQKRPHEPPAYLALARIAAASNKPELASLYYEILLRSHWDARYSYFARLAKIEYKILLRKVARGNDSEITEITASSKVFAQYASRRYLQLTSKSSVTNSGLIVAIEWNTMGADIDLHMMDPAQEHIYYSHRQARNGAMLENDNTRGMGPEIYRSPKPLSGIYKLGVKYYSNNSNQATLRTAVLVSIYKDLGTAHANVERKVIMLKSSGKVVWLQKFIIE